MAHYLITTHKNQNGTVNGLNFTDGQAELDSDNESHLTGGGTVQEILQRFEDMKFKVSYVRGSGPDVRRLDENEPAPEKPAAEKGGNG